MAASFLATLLEGSDVVVVVLVVVAVVADDEDALNGVDMVLQRR